MHIRGYESWVLWSREGPLVDYRRLASPKPRRNILKIPPLSKFSLWLLYIQSRRINLSLLPFLPPHHRDGDIIPMIPRIRSGNTQRPPQLVIIRTTQRVPDQMSTGIVVNKCPSAIREFPSFGFAFYRRGAGGRGNEFWEIGFGY